MERGDLASARRCLIDIDHPEAQYLLALAAQQQGDFATAETAYRRALYLQPARHQAADGLGRLLIDLERWDDAAGVYEDLLEISPQHIPGRYGLATAYLNRGDCELAEAIFDALIGEGNDRPEIRFMRGRARLDLGQTEAGLADLSNAHSRQASAFSLSAIANALWMRGEYESFAAIVEDAFKNPNLLAAAADLVRQSGNPEKTVAHINAFRSQGQELPIDALVVLTQAYIDTDDSIAAERTARDCLSLDPGNRGASATLITALLMQGKAEEALSTVSPLRLAEPIRQHWIAYEATALRLLGDPRYNALVDMERFVRAYELPVPKGFDSLDTFNEAFLSALDRLHPYEQHPLNQTLRLGSQTSRELTRVDDPVIAAYFDALDAPIRDYMRSVGQSDEHPLTARNTGRYRIAGSWSIKLHGGGWHVNHVHPEGWISSAYYVYVPESIADESQKAGWIKFGEPPFETEPATPAQKWVKPSAGLVVLFPSFMWHGTEPIGEGSVRVTAPFDVVPA